MRRLSETQRRVLLLLVLLVPGVLVGVKLVTGVGPSLPGPRIREKLGIVESFAPCRPGSGGVRIPDVAISSLAQATWRRERDVQAVNDEEVRGIALGDVLYVGSAVRANGDGTLFSALGTFYAYRPGAGSARRIRAMPVAADHTAVTQWQGNMYVFGGFTRGVASNRVWRYSPATKKWQELARMPRARGGLAGDVIGDRFYAVGGASSALQRNPKIYRTLDVYDFRTDTWTKGPRMPTARHHLAAAAVGGRLYVVGGRSNRSMALNELERFDPATGE